MIKNVKNITKIIKLYAMYGIFIKNVIKKNVLNNDYFYVLKKDILLKRHIEFFVENKYFFKFY
jgi:hypothetical protein